MSLPRCTKQGCTNNAALFAAMLLLSACASGPATHSSRVDADAGMATDSGVDRDVAPEAQTLFEQAVAVMAGGDLLEAEFRFQEFVLQYPDFPGAHVNLAIIRSQNEDDEGAENSITDALIIDPTYAPALNQLGMLLRRQGQFTDAEAAYRRALEVKPEYALAHYNLGVLNELYLQRLDAALTHYEAYKAAGGQDEKVDKWIVDLKRRLEANPRAASVTE